MDGGNVIDSVTSLLIILLLLIGAATSNRRYHSVLPLCVLVLFVLLFALGG